jgi:hypothetical protein
MNPTRPLPMAALVAACVVALAPQARAQTPPYGFAPAAPDAAYRDVIRDALHEFDAGNYTEALALFRRAQAIRPGARVMRGVGMVLFELRRYTESLEAIEAALTTPVDPLTPTQRADAESLRARATRYVGNVTISVSPPGAPVQVSVDGRPLAPEQRGAALRVNVGEHTIEAAATGFAPQRRAVDVQGGGTVVVPIQLVAGGGVVIVGEPPRTAIYVTSAVFGVAIAGTIGASAWYANRTYEVGRCIDAINQRGDCANAPLLATQRDLSIGTLVVTSLAVAASGAALVGLIVRARNDRAPEPPRQAFACSPTVGGAACGVTVRW